MPQDDVTWTFRGRLRPESFAAFARHRARRLSIRLEILAQDEREARMRAAGHTVLVDMFEMALSLGPADCVVTEVNREDNDGGRKG
jgi:hypothetical protein